MLLASFLRLENMMIAGIFPLPLAHLSLEAVQYSLTQCFFNTTILFSTMITATSLLDSISRRLPPLNPSQRDRRWGHLLRCRLYVWDSALDKGHPLADQDGGQGRIKTHSLALYCLNCAIFTIQIFVPKTSGWFSLILIASLQMMLQECFWIIGNYRWCFRSV